MSQYETQQAMETQELEDEDELYNIDNRYVMYSFYDDHKCLTHGEIFV